MKVEFKKKSIQIIPQNEQDEVYLESFGLQNKGDKIIAERVAPYGLDSSWAYLEVKRYEHEKD